MSDFSWAAPFLQRKNPSLCRRRFQNPASSQCHSLINRKAWGRTYLQRQNTCSDRGRTVRGMHEVSAKNICQEKSKNSLVEKGIDSASDRHSPAAVSHTGLQSHSSSSWNPIDADVVVRLKIEVGMRRRMCFNGSYARRPPPLSPLVRPLDKTSTYSCPHHLLMPDS